VTATEQLAKAVRDFREALALTIAPWLKRKTIAEHQAEWGETFKAALDAAGITGDAEFVFPDLSKPRDPDGNPVPLSPKEPWPAPHTVRFSDLDLQDDRLMLGDGLAFEPGGDGEREAVRKLFEDGAARRSPRVVRCPELDLQDDTPPF
jgi:hypothetical protein